MDYLTKNDTKISSTLQILSILAISSGFFGFVIVNLYFSLFGFWDFSFLKAQYFSAGLLFIFYIILPFVLFYAFYQGEKLLERYKKAEKIKWKSYLVYPIKIIIFVFLFCLIYMIIIIPPGFSNPALYLNQLSIMVICWNFAIYGLVGVFVQYKKDITEVTNKELNLKNTIGYLFAHFRLSPILISPFIFLIIFTIFIYPSVPRHFGGGKPVKAEIHLNSESLISELKETKYLNADFIYQSSDVVVIMVENEVFQIKKDDIAYIKYTNTVLRKNTESGTPEIPIKDFLDK